MFISESHYLVPLLDTLQYDTIYHEHLRYYSVASLKRLLDMHDLSGEQRFLNSAKRVAEGIMHFRVERNGAAFPGELSSRLCCDYGTGSAGIALFLNRLLKKQKSDFMLDSLFERSPWGHAVHGVSCRAMACGGAA